MKDSLTNQESLNLITKMIANTRYNVRQHGHLYILWGISVPMAALLHYYFIQFPMGFPPGMVWPILMVTSGVIHGIMINRLVKNQHTITIIDEAMKYLWTAFLLAMVAIIVVMIAQGPTYTSPMFLIAYGIGTYATGGILNIRSLQIGGGVCFLLGGLSAFVGSDSQLLLLAAGAVAGFLIPGILIYNSKESQS